MRLYHYSYNLFVFDPTRVYSRDPHHFKPTGLWLSVDDDEPEAHGWKQWCEGEDWNVDGLRHRTELMLSPDADVLHLSSEHALSQFTHRYKLTTGYTRLEQIDWPRVANEYQGIVIAPYQWGRRLDLMWYYSWDCASACVWDLSIVSVVKQEVGA